MTTVHERGATALDAMLALSEIASRAAPIDEVLGELARRTAMLLGVDVCSIYLREADNGRRAAGELVLRATHGLPAQAVGAVRMRVGEGLTGFAVECLRPVSVAAAASDARNKRFDGLGEERFPALCALPLIDGARAVGALVVQRRQPRAFGPREVVLVAAMAPPILLALDRAQARAERASAAEAQPGAPGRARPEEIALRGTGAAPGRALGTVAVRRARRPRPAEGPIDPAAEQARLGRALAEVAAEVAALEAWARPRLQAAQAPRALGGALAALLEDARLRGKARCHVEAGASAEQALDRVARDYVRGLGGAPDEALRDRALELEALVARLLDRLDGDAKVAAPGRLLVAHRLTVCEAVELAMRHGVGAALAGPASASPGVEVARALGLPVVCDLGALFQWAADGDRALLDGDAGLLILNPSRADEAAFRRGAPRP